MVHNRFLPVQGKNYKIFLAQAGLLISKKIWWLPYACLPFLALPVSEKRNKNKMSSSSAVKTVKANETKTCRTKFGNINDQRKRMCVASNTREELKRTGYSTRYEEEILCLITMPLTMEEGTTFGVWGTISSPLPEFTGGGVSFLLVQLPH